MTTTGPAVPRIAAPHDADALDAAVRGEGAAVVEGAYSPETVAEFLEQIDAFAVEHPEEFAYAANSTLGYYQGEHTSSLHSLIPAIPIAGRMVCLPVLLGCARRVLAPLSDSILLTNCEYMSRAPGAPRQDLHRDTLPWPHWPGGPTPISLTVLAAMTEFTTDNGATWVAPRSHGGPGYAEPPGWDAAVQVELGPGDALIYRGDTFHAGGANTGTDGHRRIFTIGYQVGWLRPVENSLLTAPPAVAAAMDPELQGLLGYSAELVLGLYKGGDPRHVLAGR